MATLGVHLLGTILAGKGVIRAHERTKEWGRVFNTTPSFN